MATNENYYTILTSYGKQALANAQASGTTVNITEFAVGDGNGSYYAPNETQTALKNEVYRAQINRITTDSNNPNWIIVEGIIPADQGGFTIREIGIFDDQNKLVAIGNYPETYKPVLSQGAGNDMYIRFIMEVENVDSVQLKIDPAIVLASRKYVDDEISTHNADQTSHNIPGQISTAINNHNTNTFAHADIRDSVNFAKLNGINFKNFIINGDFQIWQRGTTFTFGASQWGYTADRFAVSNSADGQFTASKSSVNGENALRITVDTPPTDLTGANHWHGIRYIFEGQHLYHLAIRKKSITISFTFNSNVSGEFPVAIRNLIDPSNTQSYVTTFTYISGSPKKVIVTIPIDIPDNLNPTFQKDENMGFDLVIGYLGDGGIAPSKNQWVAGTYATTSTAVNWASTAGNFIEITKLQVEEGNTATEFEYVPYDVQLLRCMRYYEDGGFYAGAPGHANINVRLNQVFFKVKKRALPTITLSIINTNGIDSVWTEEVATESFGIAGHLTVDHPWISASWTADAEL